jgi:hypothetical protein
MVIIILFKNRRKAEDFIRRIARESDKTLLLITENLNSLQEFYRLLNLADRDYKFKHLVCSSIDFINNRINWIGDNLGSTNHDPILFRSLIGCIEELQTGFSLVEEKAARRKDTITKRRCSLKIEILKLYVNQLLKCDIKPERLSLKIAK